MRCIIRNWKRLHRKRPIRASRYLALAISTPRKRASAISPAAHSVRPLLSTVWLVCPVMNSSMASPMMMGRQISSPVAISTSRRHTQKVRRCGFM